MSQCPVARYRHAGLMNEGQVLGIRFKRSNGCNVSELLQSSKLRK